MAITARIRPSLVIIVILYPRPMLPFSQATNCESLESTSAVSSLSSGPTKPVLIVDAKIRIGIDTKGFRCGDQAQFIVSCLGDIKREQSDRHRVYCQCRSPRGAVAGKTSWHISSEIKPSSTTVKTGSVKAPMLSTAAY